MMFLKNNNKKILLNKYFSLLKNSFILEKEDINYLNNEDILKIHFKEKSILEGKANKNKTEMFKFRNLNLNQDNFNLFEDFTLSSIGIGTNNANPEFKKDLQYFNAINDSIISGSINLIDTGIHYRYGKSQKVIGASLNYLIKEKGYLRDEFFISNSLGHINEDFEKGINLKNVMDLNNKNENDFFNGICFDTDFLNYQLETSLNNLRLNCIDNINLFGFEQLFYKYSKNECYKKLEKALLFLEECKKKLIIQNYGISLFSGLRVSSNDIRYVDLNIIEKIIKDNSLSGFKTIHCPTNLLTSEIFIEKYQIHNNDFISSWKKLEHMNLKVFSISPFLNGLLLQVPLDTRIFNSDYLSAKHLNFSRSLPYNNIISVLVGMSNCRHVKTNLSICNLPKVKKDDFEDWIINSLPRKSYIPENFETGNV